jgi:hypothetical protein
VRPENHDMIEEKPALPVARPVQRPRPNTGRITRLSLLMIGALFAVIFGLAFWIKPYGEDGQPLSMATHTQLGMPPCNFIVMTGKPCPACGMTTSFALLVRGDLTASLKANWAGTLIAVLWALTMVWALAGGIKGRALFIPPGRGELVLTSCVGVVLLLMLARWTVVLVGG